MSQSGSERPGVVVIGAGIVGVSTAVWLQREGLAVTLVDRHRPGDGTSYGNGGVLASISVVPVTVPGLIRKAPGMALDPDSPLFLKWGYLPKLAPWLVKYLKHCRPEEARRISAALAGIVGDSLAEHQAIARGTGAEKWIVPSNYVFVYRDRAAFEADAFGWSLRREQGYTWEELEGEAFRAYDPGYGPANNFGVRCPDHGLIADPGQYVKDLAAHVVAQGGRLVQAEAIDIAYEGGRVRGVVTDRGTMPAETVVVATGVWSKPLAARLGVKAPLESERGYHVELIEPNFMPRAPSMVAAGKFVVAPMEGRIRLAGIVEFGGLTAPASRRPFELLIKRVREAMPTLTWKDTREWMGHRPAPADSIPLIGEVGGVKGAYLGFGHHHIGLTAGPRTGRLLASLIAGKRPNIDLAPYDPVRFT